MIGLDGKVKVKTVRTGCRVQGARCRVQEVMLLLCVSCIVSSSSRRSRMCESRSLQRVCMRQAIIVSSVAIFLGLGECRSVAASARSEVGGVGGAAFGF